jgi:hypothetical protein
MTAQEAVEHDFAYSETSSSIAQEELGHSTRTRALIHPGSEAPVFLAWENKYRAHDFRLTQNRVSGQVVVWLIELQPDLVVSLQGRKKLRCPVQSLD